MVRFAANAGMVVERWQVTRNLGGQSRVGGQALLEGGGQALGRADRRQPNCPPGHRGWPRPPGLEWVKRFPGRPPPQPESSHTRKLVAVGSTPACRWLREWGSGSGGLCAAGSSRDRPVEGAPALFESTCGSSQTALQSQPRQTWHPPIRRRTMGCAHSRGGMTQIFGRPAG